MNSNARKQNRLNVFFLSLVAGLLAANAMARGVGDGAGGGRVVFQAKAISTILQDTSVLHSFETSEAIQSIEFVSASGASSIYQIHTSLGCVLNVTATANDEWATSYSVSVSPKLCRSGSSEKN